MKMCLRQMCRWLLSCDYRLLTSPITRDFTNGCTPFVAAIALCKRRGPHTPVSVSTSDEHQILSLTAGALVGNKNVYHTGKVVTPHSGVLVGELQGMPC